MFIFVFCFLKNKMVALIFFFYTDSVRAFKERNKLGQFKHKTPEEIQQQKEKEQQEEAAAKAIAIGSRCEVRLSNQPSRRGVVMFVGKEVVQRLNDDHLLYNYFYIPAFNIVRSLLLGV